MNKLKFFLISIFLAGFIFTVLLYLKTSNVAFEQKSIAYQTWFNPTEENLETFKDVSTGSAFLNTLNEKDQTFESDEAVFDFLREKSKEVAQPIPSVLKTPKESRVPIDFTEEHGVDINLPEEISYISPGKVGYEVYSYDLLLFSPDEDTLSSKYLNLEYSVIDPVSKKYLTGGKKTETAVKESEDMFNKLLEDLNDKASLKDKKIELSDKNLEKIENKEVLENISINEISFTPKDFAEEDIKNEYLSIGKISIHLENCFRDYSQDLNFSVATGKISFSDLNALVNSFCKKQFVKINGVLTGTCSDCTYYPADKNHALRPEYTPEIQIIDFAPGGGYINTKTYDDLKEMYNAAKNDGINIYVTSAYRSYSSQAATYEAWVQTEMNAGYSRAQALVVANQYSALPGFSEHQLGTAVDLNGSGCEISDGYCATNETIWKWLANNAHKYGFVQSYPSGKTAQTGYSAEAWHYRWIGKDLAQEYRNAGGGSSITLNVFLLERGDY